MSGSNPSGDLDRKIEAGRALDLKDALASKAAVDANADNRAKWLADCNSARTADNDYELAKEAYAAEARNYPAKNQTTHLALKADLAQKAALAHKAALAARVALAVSSLEYTRSYVASRPTSDDTTLLDYQEVDRIQKAARPLLDYWTRTVSLTQKAVCALGDDLEAL